MSNKKTDYDVIVVGAGPAGVVAAYMLGKNGINTLLVDKKPKEKIGDKVCGDALSQVITSELERLTGIKPPYGEELNEVTERLVLKGKRKKAVLDIPIKSQTIDRHKYGQRLLREATAFKSVSLRDNVRVVDVVVDGDYVSGVVILNKNGEKEKFSSKIVIDTSGFTGIIRRRLPNGVCPKVLRQIPKKEMIVAYRDIIITKEKHRFQKGLYLLYFDDLPMPGYYWAFSKGEKMLNIGLGYLLTKENVGKNIKEINQKVRDRLFSNYEIITSGGHQIPARLPLPSLVGNGFMTAGDAGALANPINGEGHGPALLSGAHAGIVASNAIKKADYSENALWSYNKWVWNVYGVEFALGVILIKFFEKYSYDDFDWMLAKGIIREEDVVQVLNEPLNKSQILKRALKGIYRPKLLLDLKKGMEIGDKIKEVSMKYPSSPEGFNKWYSELQKLEKAKI